MNALRDARVSRGWSQSRAIAELQKRAHLLGVSLPAASSLKTELSRWENGHRTPDAFYRQLFEAAYSSTASELGIEQDESDSLVVGGSWKESIVSASKLWRRDLNRRDFLKLSPFAASLFAGPSLHALMSVDQPPPVSTEGKVAVGTSHVEFIQQMTRNLASLDNKHGGGQVRRAAVRFLDEEVSPLLLRGNYSASVGRSLLRASAELSKLVGWMTHDVGRHALAQRYLISALSLADAADDRALAAEVLAAMSQQSTYMGQPSDAVDLARSARTLAERKGLSALVAEACVMEAHGLARAGASAECAVALSAAERALDQADRSNEPDWIGYFDEAYLSAKFGHCLRELGDHRQAVKFAERSLQMTDGYTRGRVFNLTLLAHAHADRGAVSEACAIGRKAAQAATGVQSSRMVRHLREFRRALPPAADSREAAALDRALAPVLSVAA